MSSMQCYKPAQETCQQKCSEISSCYGHKPNNGGSYYAGQSTALYGHSTFACADPNMVKPATNHSSYSQTYGQPTMANPNMSYNSYGTHETKGQHKAAAEPVGVGHSHCMDKVHGHGLAGQHALHGTASCHGKSHENKKVDHCKKKDKSLSKKKYKHCNRSCRDGNGTDSSGSDSD